MDMNNNFGMVYVDYMNYVRDCEKKGIASRSFLGYLYDVLVG